MRQRVWWSPIALGALAALVACHPAGPTPSPTPSETPSPTPSDVPSDETEARTLMVIAMVTGADNPVVDFSPLFALADLPPKPAAPPGDFSVVVWNGKTKVNEVSFDSEPTMIADCESAECEGPMYFIDVRVPIGHASYTRVELFRRAESLGFVDASKHAPVVSGVAIAPGPSGGDTVTFDASDADGDELSSIVSYSTDGGETWEVLTQNIAGGFLTVDSPALPPSADLLCRVEVSDGVLSASAVGGPFATENTPPVVWSVAELGATAFVSGNRTQWVSMVFALDNNRSMPSSSITWESSIDGPLPGGGSFDLRASDLSEGLHVITLTATDDDGATGAWSGVLRVQHEATDAPAPPITDAETVTLLRTLAAQRGLRPNVAASVNAAIAAIEAALASGDAGGVCAAFGAIGGPQGVPGPALSGADHDDEGSLAGLAEVLAAPHGCASA